MARGWQNRSIDSIEPELEQELKRKRADSNGDVFSDTSSSVSGRCFSSSHIPTSSPLTAAFVSDGVDRSGSSQDLPYKRFKSTIQPARSASSRPQSRAKPRAAARAARATWKGAYQLPESSPSFRTNTRFKTSDRTQFSFTSETSTIQDLSSASEDDDQDIPIHSFNFAENHIASSPPRTPSPSRARSANRFHKSFNSQETDQHLPVNEGADLLLYLASSPSPAMRVNKTPMLPPSTPPAKHTPLPSSMMSTPGGQTNFGFGLSTPGAANFNFADYVNVTPSPAQGPWSKTPGTIKTPNASKRRSIFETILPPPGDSPNMGTFGRSPRGKVNSLGMELGGELVS
ncbi:MAG: hypothetical protein M1828_003814 [Chrysothrix sp. TS-e1954]|nr:MAG: hypothetical protein M1828_003814 [Chrysothrix sp. TS-e1954]